MTTRSSDGSLELVITDAGLTEDAEARYTLLVEKLATYSAYVSSDQFATDHRDVGRETTVIRVMCRTPPTQKMQKITHVELPREKQVRLPVVFERFAP